MYKRQAAVRPTVRLRLEETLRSWLLHHGRRELIAAHLFVHPQTVRYRMAQLRELFGDRLDDPEEVLRLTMAPVSYTHLDVYKRQPLPDTTDVDAEAEVLPGDVPRPVGARFDENGCSAVSYTHLDVYKRQPPWGRRGPGRCSRLHRRR